MIESLGAAVLVAVVTAVINGLVVSAVVRATLSLHARGINAAHERLDAIGAPPSKIGMIPEH